MNDNNGFNFHGVPAAPTRRFVEEPRIYKYSRFASMVAVIAVLLSFAAALIFVFIAIIVFSMRVIAGS